jgi:MoaA/NifB/PqqE/SkfB family radical SAM enzyme
MVDSNVVEYTLYKGPLLEATARIEDGLVRISSSGLLSHLPMAKASLDLLDRQVPALATDKLYFSTWFPPAPSVAFSRLSASKVKAALGIRTPDQVTISITEDCPNRCQHCALPNSGRRLFLEPQFAVNLIRQCLDLGTTLIIFDGGEPSLYKDLPRLVRSVDERAVSTLFTSGAGFTSQLAFQLKEAGLQAVNVSLDSPDADEHDRMRGRVGAFSDALQAISSSLKAGLLVDIYAVLRHQNIGQLQQFHKLAKDCGAHELTFFEVVPTGRWTGVEGVTLTEEDHAALDRYVSGASLPRIFSVPSAFRAFGCFGANSWLHITPGGDVYPCACFPESWGNVLREPLSVIWGRMSRFPHRGSKKCPARERMSAQKSASEQ